MTRPPPSSTLFPYTTLFRSDLELSVEENLIIFAKLYSVPRAKRERLINELLEAVELTQWRHAQVKNLSGGMRRRVEIARGLVQDRKSTRLNSSHTVISYAVF